MKKNLYFLLTESGYPFPFHKQGDVSKVCKDALYLFGDNKRTWIVFSYAQENTKKFVLSLLDQRGRKLRELELKGCSLYLYDLSSER